MVARRQPGRGAALLWIAVVALTGLGTWWLIEQGTRGAEIATDLGVPLSVLGLVLLLTDIRRRRAHEEAAARPSGFDGAWGPAVRDVALSRSGGTRGLRLLKGRLAQVGLLALLLAAAALVVALVVPSTSGQHAPVQLKAPDFNGYCEATGQGSAQLVENDAYGWRCSAPNATGDDARAVCAWTNGTSDVASSIGSFDDPHSLQCWSATRELGGIDWDAYCRAKGWGRAQDTGTNTVYTWYCTAGGAGLDAQDACRVLYGSPAPLSRFQNYYDKNSWQCWR